MVASAAVSGLRLASRYTPAHPEVTALVEQFRRESSKFSVLWDDHTVAGLSITHKKIHHREVGQVELSYQSFDIRDAPGQQLVVATAPWRRRAPMRWHCSERWMPPAKFST